MKRAFRGKFIISGVQISVNEPYSVFTLGPLHRRRCDHVSFKVHLNKDRWSFLVKRTSNQFSLI